MHLVIRADGGLEIGYGHLMRSNALAEEFLNRNHRVTIATTTPQTAQSIFPETVGITELPSRGDPEPLVDWLNANSPDAVFTDSYPVDTDYQRAIRNKVPLTLLQDDDRHTVCADLFVNGNLYAANLDYEFVGEEPELCLGTDYVLLRREIREQAEDEPPWREQPERVVVMMGGSDIANLMPTVVRAFDGFAIHVDAVVGLGFSDTQEHSIRTAAEEVSAEVSVARDPTDLVDRMFQADFAVSTASSTTYELLALGSPIISIPVADNQEKIARSLRENKVACVLKEDADGVAICQSIKTYLTDDLLRKAHTERGLQLVDGEGTKRVANNITKISSL